MIKKETEHNFKQDRLINNGAEVKPLSFFIITTCLMSSCLYLRTVI